MNLPNYFLADLPPEATLSPAMISEACQTLKRNRERYLASRTAQSLANFFTALAESWLRPEFPFRRFALENAATAGFSRPTLERGLDNFFKQLTRENFRALFAQEFGNALDATSGAVPENAATSHATQRFWRGPEFQVHIGAGNIPNPALTSIIFGLLTRSAQFLKCASGGSFLPRLFAHSIYDADPKLGACLEIAEWRGGNVDLENALFAEADCVTATGSDETLDEIRKRLPLHVRFLGYGHRVSFAFVMGEVLSGRRAEKIISAAANDVVAWNQLGCLSPHVIYVQPGGKFLQNNLRNCWRTSWNGAKPMSRAGKSPPKNRRPSPPAARFMKSAPHTRRKPRSIGAVAIPRRGRWFSRPMRASKCRA